MSTYHSARRATFRARVLALLQSSPAPLTAQEVRLGLGETSEHMVRVALDALACEGRVVRSRRGRSPGRSWGYTGDPGGVHPAAVYHASPDPNPTEDQP